MFSDQFFFNRLINSKAMTVLPKQIFCRCWNTNMEQRAVIKFAAKLGKNASETFWLMQQVYSDDCLSRGNVFLWHKHFLEGKERLEDDNREWRPISSLLITFFDSKGIIHTEKLFISIFTIVYFKLGKNVALWEFLLVKILNFIIMI